MARTSHAAAMASSVRRLPPEDRRDQLIDAALRVFGRRHPGAVTFEEIADEAHVSRPLIYVYFRDRDALTAAVVERAVELLGQAMAQVGPSIDEISGHLPVRAYLKFGRDNPDAFRQIAGLAALTADPRIAQILRNWIELGADQMGGDARARLLTAGIAGFLRGVTTWWVMNPEVDLDEATQFTSDALACFDQIGTRFEDVVGAATRRERTGSD